MLYGTFKAAAEQIESEKPVTREEDAVMDGGKEEMNAQESALNTYAKRK